MGVKTELKTESETGPLKKERPSEKKNSFSKNGVRNGTPKGGALWSARLFYVASLFLLDFGAFRAYFGR